MPDQSMVTKEKGGCHRPNCGGDIVVIKTKTIIGCHDSRGVKDRKWETKTSSPFCRKCGVIEGFVGGEIDGFELPK